MVRSQSCDKSARQAKSPLQTSPESQGQQGVLAARFVRSSDLLKSLVLTGLGQASRLTHAPRSWRAAIRLLRHNKLADRQTSRCVIVRSERDALHVAHVERRAGFRVGRLKERIRANLVERNPNQLPHAALQFCP